MTDLPGFWCWTSGAEQWPGTEHPPSGTSLLACCTASTCGLISSVFLRSVLLMVPSLSACDRLASSVPTGASCCCCCCCCCGATCWDVSCCFCTVLWLMLMVLRSSLRLMVLYRSVCVRFASFVSASCSSVLLSAGVEDVCRERALGLTVMVFLDSVRLTVLYLSVWFRESSLGSAATFEPPSMGSRDTSVAGVGVTSDVERVTVIVFRCSVRLIVLNLSVWLKLSLSCTGASTSVSFGAFGVGSSFWTIRAAFGTVIVFLDSVRLIVPHLSACDKGPSSLDASAFDWSVLPADAVTSVLAGCWTERLGFGVGDALPLSCTAVFLPNAGEATGERFAGTGVFCLPANPGGFLGNTGDLDLVVDCSWTASFPVDVLLSFGFSMSDFVADFSKSGFSISVFIGDVGLFACVINEANDWLAELLEKFCLITNEFSFLSASGSNGRISKSTFCISAHSVTNFKTSLIYET